MWWKILLIIFALIFLFFWQSIHIKIAYDGEFQLVAGLGLIRFNVIKLVKKMQNQPKKEKKGKEKKKKKPKEEKPSVEKSNVFKDVWELRGVDGAIDLLSEFSSLLAKFGSSLARHVIIRKLYLRYSVAANDSAKTAENFGKINAALFTSLGVVRSACQLKKEDIVITPDFTDTQKEQKVIIHVSYRLLSLIAVALTAAGDFLKILKREQSINARIKARARAKALALEKKEYEEEMKQTQNHSV